MPASHPRGGGSWRSRRSAGRQTPSQVPAAASTRNATALLSGASACPDCTANGRSAASGSRRHSGKRTGSALPSTPQPSRSCPAASDRSTSSPLSGSASSSRSLLSSVIWSSGLTSPPRSRSTATVLVRPASSWSRASSRPVRSSQTPPVQRPSISATQAGTERARWGTVDCRPSCTSHSTVECSPGASAYAREPHGAAGSSVSSAASTAPSGSSPVPGPVGYSRPSVQRSAARRRISTRPSVRGSSPVSASSGWWPGRGTAYGSGPASVQRSGYQLPVLACRASRAA